MEQIEKIQYQAALAVTGAWQGSNRSQIYEEVGWESLSDRRMSRRILQSYKIINVMTPSYLKDKLPPNKRAYLFSADICNTLREIRCRSSRFMNSFYPNGVASWNIIIKHFDTMPPISKLKEYLLSLFRPNIKSTFNIYDPIGLRYIFQLRLRLSPLRNHKWRHNFIESISNICICNQGIENIDNFLFSCPLFITQRTSLITTVNEIAQKNNLHVINQPHFYLYDHHSLNDSENKKIILSTIKYIKDTRRFTN